MLYWFMQVTDLVVFHVFHLFLFFGILCWGAFIVRLLAARHYVPFTADTTDRPAASVIVPVFHEKMPVLRANLESVLAAASPDDEVIAVFDERDDRGDQLDIADPRLRVFSSPIGKRPALCVGFQNARNPIVVVTASDTQLKLDTIDELLIPLRDPKIGGVSGNVVVEDDRGIGAKCYKWSVTLRNLVIYPGLSRSGAVHVMNGELYAVRRELALEYLDEFRNQVFLGRKFDSGDDGWMTTTLLKHGHQAVFQSTAIAVTVAPRTLGEYLAQQLRWNRNSTRRTLLALRQRWAYQRGPMYLFHLLITLIRTPFWILIVGLSLGRMITGGTVGVMSSVYLEPIWSDWRIAFFVFAVILVRMIRGLPYLLRERKAFLFLPLYAFIAPFVLAPARFYAMLTARNGSWITRGEGLQPYVQRSPAIQVTAAVVVLALILVFPLGAAAIAMADDELGAY